MDITQFDFAYNATIKISEVGASKALALFPGVTDVSLNSRTFSTYVECANSVKHLMEDVARAASNETIEFAVTSEINPAHTGVETRSKDWADDEVARLWLFDKSFEGKLAIHAVGQARIFAMDKIDSVTIN